MTDSSSQAFAGCMDVVIFLFLLLYFCNIQDTLVDIINKNDREQRTKNLPLDITHQQPSHSKSVENHTTHPSIRESSSSTSTYTVGSILLRPSVFPPMTTFARVRFWRSSSLS